MRSAIPALLAMLLSASCITTESEDLPPGLEDAVVTRALPAGAWRVEEAGDPRGSVVRFEGPGGHYYAVRNLHEQDLGIVDALGRAWRNRPHRDPEWVGSGTVREGVRRILDLTDRAALRAVPLAEFEPAKAE